ncbi:aminotransferase class I/II-fold pyridoxal phosphate-dependent enzyme [Serratia ureilytica]
MDSHGFGMASVRASSAGTPGQPQAVWNRNWRPSWAWKTRSSTPPASCQRRLFGNPARPGRRHISDALNHARRSSTACAAMQGQTLSLYANNDALAELAAQPKQAEPTARATSLIATDGVFSMDGVIANARDCAIWRTRGRALVMVDDPTRWALSAPTGAAPEYCEVMGRVDIITGTLGKALGGASAAWASRRPGKEVVEWLRQRSRPYLFSTRWRRRSSPRRSKWNCWKGDALRDRLANARLFREKMTAAGFTLAGAIVGSHHPGHAGRRSWRRNSPMRCSKEGIYVTRFLLSGGAERPARIRTQMSADHPEQIERAVAAAFTRIGAILALCIR